MITGTTVVEDVLVPEEEGSGQTVVMVVGVVIVWSDVIWASEKV